MSVPTRRGCCACGVGPEAPSNSHPRKRISHRRRALDGERCLRQADEFAEAAEFGFDGTGAELANHLAHLHVLLEDLLHSLQ